nr:MAG TPA: hypothetical protein [Caudoviricetes sp.]
MGMKIHLHLSVIAIVIISDICSTINVYLLQIHTQNFVHTAYILNTNNRV